MQTIGTTDSRTLDPRVGLALLIGLNLVPLFGVLNWGWQTFDLIFLYWMENVIIGLFALARMVIRPYGHALELAFPLFLAPFFALHYGGFCFGHGTFVVGLFGDSVDGDGGLIATALAVASTPTMLYAIGALALIQLMDWVRDTLRHGLGADGVKELMVKPYRRIVVLHITILAGGFALQALGQPIVGLMILVLVKTASDVWHWRREDAAESDAPEETAAIEEEIAKIAEEYARPVVTVNGQEKEFGSFREMKASKEFRMAMAVMRFMGASKEMKILTTYLDRRIAVESDRAAKTESIESAA